MYIKDTDLGKDVIENLLACFFDGYPSYYFLGDLIRITAITKDGMLYWNDTIPEIERATPATNIVKWLPQNRLKKLMSERGYAAKFNGFDRREQKDSTTENTNKK